MDCALPVCCRVGEVWRLGCLIWEVFNGPLPRTSSLRSLGKVLDVTFAWRICCDGETVRNGQSEWNWMKGIDSEVVPKQITCSLHQRFFSGNEEKTSCLRLMLCFCLNHRIHRSPRLWSLTTASWWGLTLERGPIQHGFSRTVEHLEVSSATALWRVTCS